MLSSILSSLSVLLVLHRRTLLVPNLRRSQWILGARGTEPVSDTSKPLIWLPIGWDVEQFLPQYANIQSSAYSSSCREPINKPSLLSFHVPSEVGKCVYLQIVLPKVLDPQNFLSTNRLLQSSLTAWFEMIWRKNSLKVCYISLSHICVLRVLWLLVRLKCF